MRPDPIGVRVAASVPCTRAEGPFERYALWVQGCSLRCPGCCNPEMFKQGGRPRSVASLLEDIAAAQQAHGIEGLTLLGGEPVEQAAALVPLCAGVRNLGLGIVLFSGYRIHEIQDLAHGRALWEHVDTVVDGRFDASQPEGASGRRFIGSRNQALHHRTPRYADPALWTGPPCVEVEIGEGLSLEAHGFPGPLEALLDALR